MTYGLWKARYWAVLGFQTILILVIVVADPRARPGDRGPARARALRASSPARASSSTAWSRRWPGSRCPTAAATDSHEGRETLVRRSCEDALCVHEDRKGGSMRKRIAYHGRGWPLPAPRWLRPRRRPGNSRTSRSTATTAGSSSWIGEVQVEQGAAARTAARSRIYRKRGRQGREDRHGQVRRPARATAEGVFIIRRLRAPPEATYYAKVEDEGQLRRRQVEGLRLPRRASGGPKSG